MRIKLNLYDKRIFTCLYLLCLDYYCLLDNFDKYQFINLVISWGCPVRLENRTIGVNLAIFHDIFSRCRPYGAKELEQTRFYTDAEEIPKQINPTGLKRVSGASKVYG